MPPVRPPMRAAASSCAARSPSLTAARTMSCSSSGSSGSMASASMEMDFTMRSPLTFTVTMPPPAEASTSSFLSCSCAATMSCCIFWTCWSILFMFGGWGIGALLFGDVLGIEFCLEASQQLVLARRRGAVGGRVVGQLAHVEDELRREPGDRAYGIDERLAVRGRVDLLALEALGRAERDGERLALERNRHSVRQAGAEQAVGLADGFEHGGPEVAHRLEGRRVDGRRGGGRGLGNRLGGGLGRRGRGCRRGRRWRSGRGGPLRGRRAGRGRRRRSGRSSRN